MCSPENLVSILGLIQLLFFINMTKLRHFPRPTCLTEENIEAPWLMHVEHLHFITWSWLCYRRVSQINTSCCLYWNRSSDIWKSTRCWDTLGNIHYSDKWKTHFIFCHIYLLQFIIHIHLEFICESS